MKSRHRMMWDNMLLHILLMLSQQLLVHTISCCTYFGTTSGKQIPAASMVHSSDHCWSQHCVCSSDVQIRCSQKGSLHPGVVALTLQGLHPSPLGSSKQAVTFTDDDDILMNERKRERDNRSTNALCRSHCATRDFLNLEKRWILTDVPNSKVTR